MQAVTFKCDACGVKLPVCPEYNQLSEAEREEAKTYQFFRVSVIPTVILAMHNPRDQLLPTHAASANGAPSHLDICRRCAESRSLLALLVPTVRDAEA